MKRKRKKCSERSSNKRPRIVATTKGAVDHPVLSKFYHHVLPLRQWLLRRLEPASKRRRKCLQDLGRLEVHNNGHDDNDFGLDRILDGVMVGYCDESGGSTTDREVDAREFSQRITSSVRTSCESARSPDGVDINEVCAFGPHSSTMS